MAPEYQSAIWQRLSLSKKPESVQCEMMKRWLRCVLLSWVCLEMELLREKKCNFSTNTRTAAANALGAMDRPDAGDQKRSSPVS